MITRRKLLSGAPILGAVSALSMSAAFSEAPAPRRRCNEGESIVLEEGWHFRPDPKGTARPPDVAGASAEWQSVTVPHTWQALGGSPEHVGVGWYRTKIFAPEIWRNLFVRVEFEAVYHTAHIFLNGTRIGEHIGKGYTAFSCDLSPHLHYAEANELQVRVDNSFSNTMLPRMESFDWANDGGITRPVHLLITPPVFIERLEIDAVPDLESNVARVSVYALIRNTRTALQAADISASVRYNGTAAREYAGPPMVVNLPPESST